MAENVFQTEILVNLIFDNLEMKDKINLSLCNKKINSFFNKRPKILKTSIEIPHRDYLQDIEIPLLNKIFSKYKNIKKMKTLFNSNKELNNILDLNFVSNLEILEIKCIVSNIDVIKNFINLKELNLYWNYQQDEVTNLSFLSNLVNLEKLTLRDGEVTSIESIKGLIKLKELYIFNVKIGNNMENDNYSDYSFLSSKRKTNYLDITPVSYLSNLEKIDIYKYINSIEPIKLLKNLREIKLSIKISDLSIFSNFTNLKKLKVSGEIKSIEPIVYLSNLEELIMWNEVDIPDISLISNLINLKILDINFPGFKDLNIIKGLINLEEIDLANREITDISPLSNLTN